MKRLVLGIVLFVLITAFFGLQDNLELAMNAAGMLGLLGILIGGFLKTGFISSTAPVIGNLAVIKLDQEIDLSNTVLLIALPNLIGAFFLYFLR